MKRWLKILFILILPVLLAAGCRNGLLESLSAVVERYNGDSEITLTWNDGDIERGDSLDAGALRPGESTTVEITIENRGVGDLELTGTPPVIVTGNADFSISEQPVPSLRNGESSELLIEYSPMVSGDAEPATVTIYCNDPAHSTFSFSLTGQCLSPGLEVSRDGTIIADGGGYAFSTPLEVGESESVEFTLANTGESDLHLTATPLPVYITGDPSDSFSIDLQPDSLIPEGSTDTFTLTYAPTAAGDKTATLTIENDDPDRSLYEITLNASVASPDIAVYYGTENAGPTTSIGGTLYGTSMTAEFIIRNNGSADLTLEDPAVRFSGGDASLFSVTVPPASDVLSPGGETTFTIEFTPDDAGSFNSTVFVDSDDPDGSLAFIVQGVGTQPGIALSHEGSGLAFGDSVDFGTVPVSDAQDLVFTISNSGQGTLLLDGDPVIGFSGSSCFSLAETPELSIASGESTTFTVRYSPDEITDHSATISISSNDLNTDPFTLDLTGNGEEWHGIKNIDPVGSSGYNPQIEARGDTVYVVHRDHTNQDMRFGKSVDGGASFTFKSLDESSGYPGYYSSLVVDGSNIYISYYEGTGKDLKFARSTDGGDNFTISTIESTGTTGPSTSLVLDNGILHLAYQYTSGDDVRYRKSSDGGVSWTDYVEIDTAIEDGGSISMSVSGSNVYICHRGTGYYPADNRIYFSYSLDGGITFTTPGYTYGYFFGGAPYGGTVASSGSTVYATFHSTVYKFLRFQKSLDGGVSWSDTVVLDGSSYTPVVETGYGATILLDGSDLYIVYCESTGSYRRLARSSDGGDTWALSTIEGGQSTTSYIDMSVTGDYLYVAYYGTGGLRIAKSRNRGTTW